MNSNQRQPLRRTTTTFADLRDTVEYASPRGLPPIGSTAALLARTDTLRDVAAEHAPKVGWREHHKQPEARTIAAEFTEYPIPGNAFATEIVLRRFREVHAVDKMREERGAEEEEAWEVERLIVVDEMGEEGEEAAGKTGEGINGDWKLVRKGGREIIQ